MSTNSECQFLHLESGWFYLLEYADAPRNAFDWRDYAKAYGPFVSRAAAEDHLRKNHANPGGSSGDQAGDPARKLDPSDETLKRLIKEATKPSGRNLWR